MNKFPIILLTLLVTFLHFPTSTCAQTENAPSEYGIKVSNQQRKIHESLQKFKTLKQEPPDAMVEFLKAEWQKPLHNYSKANWLYFHLYYWVHHNNDEEEILARFNTLLEQNPNDPFLLMARSIFLYIWGYEIRGTGWASSVSEEQKTEMMKHFTLAYEDLQKTVKQDPKMGLAWEFLINVSLFFPDKNNQLPEYYFRKARLEVPDYYGIYSARLRSLQTKWGGSFLQAQAFAEKYSDNTQFESLMPFLMLESLMDLGETLQRHKDTLEQATANDILTRWVVDNVIKPISKEEFFQIQGIWHEVSVLRDGLTKAHPDFLYAINLYSRFALSAGADDVAEEHLKKIISIDPGYDIFALYRLGHIEEKRKNYDSALLYYEIADKIWPNNPRPKDLMALIYSKTNRRVNAMQIYEQLVQSHPDKEIYWASLCSEQAGVRQLEKALVSCNKAIEINPDYAWPYHLKGWTVKWMGKKEEGETLIQKAKELGWTGYKE